MHAIRHPDAAGITPGPAATPTSRLAWRGLGLWLAAVAWFAAFAWVRPLAMPDEGRYLSVAWEMLASGNWLVPTHDGLPFFHKPPLFYWLADAAMAVAGPSALAGRLPSIVAAAGLAWGMHAFDARWTGRNHARMVLLVLATTPYVYFAAQYANMDMLVAACIAGAVLCAAHAALRAMDGREPGPALVAAYGAAGAGVLAKGLIGFALPLAIVVAWLLFERRAKLLVRLVSPAGIALFLAIVLPWPLAMQARYPGFFDYFIVEQHVHRFAGAGFNNAQPWWFFLPVVLVLTMPWSVAVLPLWRGRAPAVHPPHRALRSLMACWALVVLAFFSIPQSKLIGYALPAAAPLAWLMADALASSGPHRFARRRVCAVAGLSCFLLLATVGVYAWRAPHSSRAVADVLASRRLAGEPVVFVGTYLRPRVRRGPAAADRGGAGLGRSRPGAARLVAQGVARRGAVRAGSRERPAGRRRARDCRAGRQDDVDRDAGRAGVAPGAARAHGHAGEGARAVGGG